ncbi:MAG: NUDIX domain-containing protein [bacterium]
MVTKDEVLSMIRELSQDDLKEVLATGILLIQNPEKGIGTALFESVFHIVPQPCVELAVVDKIGNPTRVLLTRRAADDPTYAGKIHCPGTYIRKGETTPVALERCVRRELGVGLTDYRFATHYNNPVSCGGDDPGDGRNRHTVGLVHLVQLSGEPTTQVERKWTNAIPSDLLRGHQDFLKATLPGWDKTNQPLFGPLFG